jgi:hypothetical protein
MFDQLEFDSPRGSVLVSNMNKERILGWLFVITCILSGLVGILTGIAHGFEMGLYVGIGVWGLFGGIELLAIWIYNR